ncbi:MAG TPA: peptide chain release factor N(5)-glutamine methyltransferase [Alphaproteobacteria bacterium]|nr:peptide chain release factor N(5)-glutamine methyltransferase [Alphaproteobacteria bacterium]
MKVNLTAATRRAALKEAVLLMKAAGLDTPVLDARLIVQHALRISWDTLYLKDDQPLEPQEKARLESGLARRAAHEPVSRIVGRRHFWTLDLAVSPDTLDPRADTESLIETVVQAIPDRTQPLRVLDLGTGTGAILLALLAEYPNATGLGIDRSEAALAVARANADSHGLSPRVTFSSGNWTDGVEGPFDIIVSNPPYIESGHLPGLPPEVREHDPVLALDGGTDGLDAYRAIIPAIPALLGPGGLAVFEIGEGQGDAVTRIARENGLAPAGSRKDLGGIARALSFKTARTL